MASSPPLTHCVAWGKSLPSLGLYSQLKNEVGGQRRHEALRLLTGHSSLIRGASRLSHAQMSMAQPVESEAL